MMRQHQHQIDDILANIYQAMAYDVAQNPPKASGGKFSLQYLIF